MQLHPYWLPAARGAGERVEGAWFNRYTSVAITKILAISEAVKNKVCLVLIRGTFLIFSSVVSVTAVLMQSVRGEQKLQTADFRSLGNVLPP